MEHHEQSHQNTGPDMREEWCQQADPSSGRIFYYNQRTGQTQWEAPSGNATSFLLGNSKHSFLLAKAPPKM
jgi:hypothetical protein